MATSTLGSDLLTSTTNTGRDPWQESLSRLSTVPASKVLEAAEVIRGFSGSWAAQYLFDEGISTDTGSQDPRCPGPQQIKTNLLGQPGFPEINFAPYSYCTNRFGSKGGSLIGHPISFSVVGPTAKNPNTDWYWKAFSNIALPGVGDALSLRPVPGVTIPEYYGLTPASLDQQFPGGLYVIISLTGSRGSVYNNAGATVAGGAGDGLLNAGLTPIEAIYPFSKYEIFRVSEVTDTDISLDPGKRLASYFTFSIPNNYVKAITLITPVASRLVAVPCGEEKGSETIFAIMPPKRASNHDEQYDFDIWNSGAGWNEIYPSEPDQPQGTGFEYRQKPLIPIPKPKGVFNGRVWGEGAEVAVSDAAGHFTIAQLNTLSGQTEPSIGDLIHIHNIRVKGNAHLAIAPVTGFQASLTSLLGWFEVTAYFAGAPDSLTVRRYEEADPKTGCSYLGAPESFVLGNWAAGDRIELDITVHDSIDKLWSTSYADIDKINSARLTNIIDPRWVERSAKQTNIQTKGTQPSRADKAIFDTQSTTSGISAVHSNPGNLLDLGFRPVLFSANKSTIETSAGGVAEALVPRFNLPVDSNEIILDPSKLGEKQYVDIDYANGLVRFSHPIKSGSPLYPSANVFTSTDNIRGEMVLFISCVPYSMEEGQLGSSVRVSGGSSISSSVCNIAGETPESDEYIDAYGERLMFPLYDQTVSSVNIPGSIVQVVGGLLGKVPPAGTVELLLGTDGSGGPMFSQGIYSRTSCFSYAGLTEGPFPIGTVTNLNEAYGGGLAGVDNYVVDADHPAVAVWRREITLPCDLTGQIGSDYHFDTTYGSAKRTKAIRINDSELLNNLDGTVTVKPRNTAVNKLFDDLFSSWLLEGGAFGVPAPAVMGTNATIYDEAVVIIHGIRRIVPGGVWNLPDESIHYMYIHQDKEITPTCLEVLENPSLPLPDPEDILLAKVDTHAVNLSTIDLRNPLQDLNLRTSLYVGKFGDGTGDWPDFKPHFKTLREAVDYANEIMTPEDNTALGPAITIKVVGHTVEDLSLGPITIKTDGLIIEGSPWALNDDTITEYTYPEIFCDVTGHNCPLFDLNGHSKLTFRDLAIRTPFDTDAGVPNTFFMFMDYQLGAFDTDDITIDNIKVTNYCAGLVLMTAASDHIPHSHRWRITRNSCQCIYIGIGFTGDSVQKWYLSDSVIEDNYLLGEISSYLDVGILLGGDSTEVDYSIGPNFWNWKCAYDVKIARNTLNMVVFGIVVSGTQIIVEDNVITTTEDISILAGSAGIRIQRNLLTNIHKVAPTLYAPRRYGIYLANGCATPTPAVMALTFDAGAKTITRSVGSWLTEQYAPDSYVTVAGAAVPANDGDYLIQRSVVNTGTVIKVLKVNGGAMANEGPTAGLNITGSNRGSAPSTISENLIYFFETATKYTAIYATNVTANDALGEPVYVLDNLASVYNDAEPPTYVYSDILVDLERSTIRGNICFELDEEGAYNSLCDNQVADDLTVGGLDDSCYANHVLGDIILEETHIRCFGNHSDGDMYLNVGNLMVSGNHVDNIIMNTGTQQYVSISGNRVITNLGIDSTESNIVGNLVGGNITLTLASNNNIISSNWVGGDIAVTSDNTPKPIGLIVIGNHVVGNITNSSAGNPPNYVALGNHAAATVFEIVVGGARDAAHNVSV